jgi:phospholipase D-like protein
MTLDVRRGEGVKPGRGQSETQDTGLAGPWLIPEQRYLPVVTQLFAAARRRCLVSLFIVGGEPWHDRDRLVDGLLVALADAAWRGVDARLLVGGGASATMVQLAESAQRRARTLAVPCRWLTDVPRLGGHARVLIADDHVLVGSSDPSLRAYREPRESVCIVAASLADQLSRRFDGQWLNAEEEARGTA